MTENKRTGGQEHPRQRQRECYDDWYTDRNEANERRIQEATAKAQAEGRELDGEWDGPDEARRHRLAWMRLGISPEEEERQHIELLYRGMG